MAIIKEIRFFLIVLFIFYPAQAVEVFLANAQGDYNIHAEIEVGSTNDVDSYICGSHDKYTTVRFTDKVILYIVTPERFSEIMDPQFYADRMAIGRNLSKSFGETSDPTMRLDASYSELLYLGLKDFKKQQDEPFIRAFIRDKVQPNLVDSVEFYTIGNIDLETISVRPSLSKVKEFRKYKGDCINIFNKLQTRLKSMKKKK